MAARNPWVKKRAKRALFTVTLKELSKSRTTRSVIEQGTFRSGPRFVLLIMTDMFCLSILAG